MVDGFLVSQHVVMGTRWVFMFYVIICNAPVAIVIQCFIDASDFVFSLIINRYLSY